MKTTNKDFKLFMDSCDRWVDYFGLLDWEVDYFHEELPGPLAITSAQYKTKAASITMNTEWEDQYKTDAQIKRCAFHEVCELLLMEFNILARSRYLDEEDIAHAIHTIIQRLTNTVYRDIGDK